MPFCWIHKSIKETTSNPQSFKFRWLGTGLTSFCGFRFHFQYFFFENNSFVLQLVVYSIQFLQYSLRFATCDLRFWMNSHFYFSFCFCCYEINRSLAHSTKILNFETKILCAPFMCKHNTFALRIVYNTFILFNGLNSRKICYGETR